MEPNLTFRNACSSDLDLPKSKLFPFSPIVVALWVNTEP